MRATHTYLRSGHCQSEGFPLDFHVTLNILSHHFIVEIITQ